MWRSLPGSPRPVRSPHEAECGTASPDVATPDFAEPVSGLIPCWQEALTKLKVGGKLKAYCPSSLAYGDVGNPIAGVPGGSAIVFDFELLEVLKPEPAPKQPK